MFDMRVYASLMRLTARYFETIASMIDASAALLLPPRRRNNVVELKVVDDEYDSDKDVAGSFEDAYAAVRARKAAGGKGWEPK